MSVVIQDAHLKFNGEQRRRPSTSVIVLHHTGERVLQSVETIHDYYLHRVDPGGVTYIGIAYHYYVRKDGSVWKGREEWALGGHAGAVANPISIGICFEGDYETEPAMPAAQLDAGKALVGDLLGRYGALAVKRHSDYMSTDCPGRYFPFGAIASGSAAAQPAASAVETVRGTSTTYYVRTQPSTASPSIGVVRGGQHYATEQAGGGWRRITFSGRQGYVGPAAWQ